MHELSIMTGILDIVLESAGRNGARKIQSINLTIGALSDIMPEWAQRYFDMLSKDTIADGARIVITSVPAEIKCRSCLSIFPVTPGDWKFSCRDCGSADIEIISGREFTVTSIEIE